MRDLFFTSVQINTWCENAKKIAEQVQLLKTWASELKGLDADDVRVIGNIFSELIDFCVFDEEVSEMKQPDLYFCGPISTRLKPIAVSHRVDLPEVHMRRQHDIAFMPSKYGHDRWRNCECIWFVSTPDNITDEIAPISASNYNVFIDRSVIKWLK